MVKHAKEELHIFNEDSKKYTTELQWCVHSLLENHVSTKRVGPVIAACLKLVGKKTNRLPSGNTVNNMNAEINIITETTCPEVFNERKYNK